MQAATGELNLTLVTVVAIGALLALFTAVLWPQIKNKIKGSFNTSTNNAPLTTSIMNNNHYRFADYIESELF